MLIMTKLAGSSYTFGISKTFYLEFVHFKVKPFSLEIGVKITVSIRQFSTYTQEPNLLPL